MHGCTPETTRPWNIELQTAQSHTSQSLCCPLSLLFSLGLAHSPLTLNATLNSHPYSDSTLNLALTLTLSLLSHSLSLSRSLCHSHSIFHSYSHSLSPGSRARPPLNSKNKLSDPRFPTGWGIAKTKSRTNTKSQRRKA